LKDEADFEEREHFMKKVHVVTLATLLLLFTAASAQQNAPATETKSPPPPGTVTGSGTTNYVPLWTGSTTLGNSYLYEANGGIGINTTSPHYSLDVNGHINGTGYLIGGYLMLTTPGGASNVALGYEVMQSNTGSVNTGVGQDAMEFNTSGVDNSAVGAYALGDNTTGSANSAFGTSALSANSVGFYDTAVGTNALYQTTSSYNTATGFQALGNDTTGTANTAIGFEAGMSIGTGNFNIAIGDEAGNSVASGSNNNIEIGSSGSSADSGAIRIGTAGTQSSFFAAGVRGITTGDNDAVPVLIDTNGQLGTVSSSRRFKEDIQDMGDASRDLMRLRPVTFRYQKPFANGSLPKQYGLIAEEVAEVYPDLVAHSADGQIETVKYQLLDPMLLNEVQRQQAQIHELQERLDKIESALVLAGK
jgi:Chaperone of endosialidase